MLCLTILLIIVTVAALVACIFDTGRLIRAMQREHRRLNPQFWEPNYLVMNDACSIQ